MMNQHDRPLTTDTALRLLSTRQRRAVLRRLTDTGEPITVESLTASLATGSTPPDAVRIQLLHRDLPKLHDDGVIDYDADGRTVRRGPGFDRVATLLEAVDATREPVPGTAGYNAE